MSEDRAQVSLAPCDSYEIEEIRRQLRALLDSLGGIGRFVSEGQTVLIKPNLLSPCKPEEAVTTHPSLVQVIIEMCVEAGASRVWVGDSCAGKHADEVLWGVTGMKEAVENGGGELKSFNGSVISLGSGENRFPVPQWYSEVDCLISLPKLKTHLLTTVTIALKNIYGLVVGQAKALYHRSYPSPRKMSSFLVEIHEVLRPTLSVVDGVEAMEGDGPANGRPSFVGLLLAGTDAAAIDAVCAQLFGLKPCELPMVRAAAEQGIGITDLKRIDMIGDGSERLSRRRLKLPHGRFLQRLPECLFGGVSLAIRFRPKVYNLHCVRCGVCAETCTQEAISQNDEGEFVIDGNDCILCMCCIESCPQHAIDIDSPLKRLKRALQSLLKGLS